MHAIKLKMRQGFLHSNNPMDIESIYIEGDLNGYYKAEEIYKMLKTNSSITIYLNHSDQFLLIPAVSVSGLQYVRSTPNLSTIDCLMKLPRE